MPSWTNHCEHAHLSESLRGRTYGPGAQIESGHIRANLRARLEQRAMKSGLRRPKSAVITSQHQGKTNEEKEKTGSPRTEKKCRPAHRHAPSHGGIGSEGANGIAVSYQGLTRRTPRALRYQCAIASESGNPHRQSDSSLILQSSKPATKFRVHKTYLSHSPIHPTSQALQRDMLVEARRILEWDGEDTSVSFVSKAASTTKTHPDHGQVKQ